MARRLSDRTERDDRERGCLALESLSIHCGQANAGSIEVRDPGTAARGRPFSLGRHAWDLSGLPWRAALRHEAEFELGHHSPLTSHLARAVTSYRVLPAYYGPLAYRRGRARRSRSHR